MNSPYGLEKWKKIQAKDENNLSVYCSGDSNKSMCGQSKNKFKVKIEII